MKNKVTRGFHFFNITQFLGAFNDNVFKLLVIFTIVALNGHENISLIVSKAGIFFVVPFLVFTPFAGIITDKFSKRNIIVLIKILEIAIMFCGVIMFAQENKALIYIVLFLMSAQSAFFGPVKYGIIPELVNMNNIAYANGLMVMFTFFAIILGTFWAPFLSQLTNRNYLITAWFCVAVAVLGTVTSFFIPATKTIRKTDVKSGWFLTEIWTTLKSVRKDKKLIFCFFASAYFYLIGAFIQLNLIPFGMSELGLSQERSGYLFLVAALGIGLGSFIAGKILGKTIKISVARTGAMGLGIMLSLFFICKNPVFIVAVVLFSGLSAGIYILPIQTFIQVESPDEHRGKIISISNFLGWIGILLASFLIYLFSETLHFYPSQGFLLLGILTVILTILTMTVLKINLEKDKR